MQAIGNQTLLKIKDDNQIEVNISSFLLSPISKEDSFTLIYTLKKNVSVFIKKEEFSLSQDEFLVINPSDFFYIRQEEPSSLLLTVSIDKNFFHNSCLNTVSNKRLLAAQMKNPDLFSSVREKIMKLLYISNKYSFHLKYELFSTLSDIVSFLSNNGYYIPLEKPTAKEDEDRMSMILNLVKEHTSTNFSMADLASSIHLNYFYASHFFVEQAGFSFKEYQTSQKLFSSIEKIISNEDKITNIALDSGFNSAITYSQSFKQFFLFSPQDMKQILINPEKTLYRTKSQEELFAQLEKRFSSMEVDSIKEQVSIKDSEKPSRLNKCFLKVIGISRAYELLYASNQKMLKDVMNNIRFEYIKLRGIFNDEMMILTRQNDKDIYNYSYLDQVVDFVISLNLKPYIELDFMPKDLASKDVTLYYWRANMSLPNDYQRWSELIKNTISHLVKRYGVEKVRTWYFDTWNKPNYQGVFFNGNKEDYFNFFLCTYKAIKSVDPYINIGGPNIAVNGDYTEYLKGFIDTNSKEGIKPDFYSVQVYGDLAKKFEAIRSENNFLVIQKREMNDPDFMDRCLTNVRSTIGNQSKLVVSEWNISARTNFYIRDTAFMGPYIIDTMLKSQDKIDMLCIWLLTDAIEENKAPNSLFHGGLGLMTVNGLYKPSFYAFYFLSKLYDKIVDKGHGYIVTKENDNYSILLYNLAYFDTLGINSDFHSLNITNAYSFFKKRGNKEYHMSFEGQKGRYVFHKESISRKHGSIFDEFVKSGFTNDIDGNQKEYLKSKSHPLIEETSIVLDKGQEIVQTLEEHEMSLIQIKRIED